VGYRRGGEGRDIGQRMRDGRSCRRGSVGGVMGGGGVWGWQKGGWGVWGREVRQKWGVGLEGNTAGLGRIERDGGKRREGRVRRGGREGGVDRWG